MAWSLKNQFFLGGNIWTMGEEEGVFDPFAPHTRMLETMIIG